VSSSRRIARIATPPPLGPGFVGPGHLASAILAGDDFAETDPFIMLADDHLDIGDRPVGGPHPHAGFETVTLLLEGSLYDRDEGGVINTGEVQWMTAGRGIIHGENVAAHGRVRLLQLWLTLPHADRWTTPAFQDIHVDAIPVRREPGVDVRVYSGTSGDARSPTRNHVPVTLVEIALEPGASVDQRLPSSYNGFLFVIAGSIAGDDGARLETNQVGWLDRPNGRGDSVLRIAAARTGARVVLYAGEPQGVPIVSHGPFIGESREDIVRLYAEYRAGRFEKMSTLARGKRVASAAI
jgi:redox-sensitive bicupin YhaK (pirin superfamily)